MGFFKKLKHKGYLGIDIGTASIKAVELQKKGGTIHLRTYGFVDLPNNIIRSTSTEFHERIVRALNEIVKKAHIRSKKVIAALPGFSVFTTMIEIPKIPSKEIESAVMFEAKKYIPESGEDMVIDWKIVDSGETKQDTLHVLINAAPRRLIDVYKDICKQAGLELVSLETESFSLTRSLTKPGDPPLMIIDVGATATDISIVENTYPILTKSVDVGGNAITYIIANSLNIEQGRAEQFKRDYITQRQGASEHIPQAIRSVVDQIILHIKNIEKLYASKSDRKIEKVILAGGSAKLPYFQEYLKEVLNTTIEVGDPWKGITYDQVYKNEIEQVSPMFAVAIGLALKEIT